MIKTVLAKTHAARTYALAVTLAIVGARYVPGNDGSVILPVVAGILGLPLPAVEADAVKVAKVAEKVAPEVAKVAPALAPATSAVDSAAEAVTSLAR